MPVLIKSVEAKVLDNFMGSVYVFSSVSASIQFEDYIKLNSFTAYLQNFTKADYVEYLTKPMVFGLNNQYNLEEVTLEISY